jgi:undecaprenyl diphosphate synthase
MSKNSTKKYKIENVPQHVAIIMDGNRRWAKKRHLPGLEGHRKGAEVMEELFDAAKEAGVKYLTTWAFSTENWGRSKKEINYLFGLFRKKFDQYKEKFLKEHIRFIHLGRKDRIPGDIKEMLIDLEDVTKDFSEHTAVLAIDYGGRDEISRAATKLSEKGEKITEESIEKNLDTAGIPDPDLIIRTSGEQRLSGFMLWQSAYSELYFTDTHFPAFTKDELMKALQDYSDRERRFGGDSKKK